MRSETLFLKRSIDLAEIKKAIEGAGIGSCDSVEVPGSERDQAFLQYQEHSVGFPQSVTISWHEAAVNDSISVDSLARHLANKLTVSVLYEAPDSVSDSTDEKWYLAVPGQVPRYVQVLETSDGNDVLLTV